MGRENESRLTELHTLHKAILIAVLSYERAYRSVPYTSYIAIHLGPSLGGYCSRRGVMVRPGQRAVLYHLHQLVEVGLLTAIRRKDNDPLYRVRANKQTQEWWKDPCQYKISHPSKLENALPKLATN